MIKVETREYTDKDGNKVLEYFYKDMRLRTIMEGGIKTFNYQDINSFISYEPEEVFEFLLEALGDELFNYLDEGKKGACQIKC